MSRSIAGLKTSHRRGSGWSRRIVVFRGRPGSRRRPAGTSESQLIKHFGSKEGLLEALFESLWVDLNAQVAQLASAHRDPVERLRAIVTLLIGRIAGNNEIRRLMLFEGRRIGSRGAALSAGFVRFVEGLDDLLKEAPRAGRVRVQLPPAVSRSLMIGACEGLLRDRLLAEDADYPGGYSRKDIERAMMALIETFFETN